MPYKNYVDPVIKPETVGYSKYCYGEFSNTIV